MATTQKTSKSRLKRVSLPQDKTDRFKHPLFRAFEHMFPVYVLIGMKKPDDSDIYALAENFMFSTDSYQRIANALHKYRLYVNKDGYSGPDPLAVMYCGTKCFGEYEKVHGFWDANSELVRQCKPDFIKMSKYLLYGYAYRNWYQEARRAFKKQLPEYHLTTFIRLFALTSPRTHFSANVQNALHAYHLYQSGKPFLEAGFTPNVTSLLEAFRSGDLDFSAPQTGTRRKVVNFARALCGDKQAVVVDTWLLQAYGIQEYYSWRGKSVPHSPRVSEYNLIEAHIRGLAEICGYEPRQIVSMLWAGMRIAQARHKEASTEKLLAAVLDKAH